MIFFPAFEHFFVFGDSLSDAGSYATLEGTTTGGRFTTLGGHVWDEYLGEHLGLTVTNYHLLQVVGPHEVCQRANDPFEFTAMMTGDNYAIGGARVNHCPGTPENQDIAAAVIPLKQQLDEFFASHDPRHIRHALYSVWVGGNDIIYQMGVYLEASKHGQTYDVHTPIHDAALQEVSEIKRLLDAGAHQLIVFGVPMVGESPLGFQSPGKIRDLFNEVSVLYNQTLKDALESKGLTSKILYIDIATEISKVMQEPEKYGFTNVHDAACAKGSSLYCQTTGVGYFFADNIHPTDQAHQLIANYVFEHLK